MIDLCIAVNILLTVAVFAASFYSEKPQRLPLFLFALTLYRLALNVAVTRLILSEGNVGSLITFFGEFIAEKHLIAGSIFFIFVTMGAWPAIRKTANQIAAISDFFECNRSFKAKRKETAFYEAMNNVSKCMRFDAAAGLLLIVINIVCGLASAMILHDISFEEASRLYLTLAIGSGLIMQIPALFASVAASEIMTTVSLQDNVYHLFHENEERRIQARSALYAMQNAKKAISMIQLDQELEIFLEEAAAIKEMDMGDNIHPVIAQQIIEVIRAPIQKAIDSGAAPIVVTSPRACLWLKETMAYVPCFARSDIPKDLKLKLAATVGGELFYKNLN